MRFRQEVLHSRTVRVLKMHSTEWVDKSGYTAIGDNNPTIVHKALSAWQVKILIEAKRQTQDNKF